MIEPIAPAAHATTATARIRNRAGTASLWLAGFVALSMPTGLAFFKAGGYTVEWQTLALVVAFCGLAAVAAFAPWPPLGRGPGLAALAALVALTAWSAVSIAWARVVGDAAHDVVRLTLYCAVFGLALAAARVERLRRYAPDVLLACATLVAVYALAGRLFPDLVEQRVSAIAGERLNQPLTYWNALGILMSIGVLLAVSVASDDRRPRAWRAVACGLAVPCGMAAFLTFSRGSWIALAVGVLVLVLLRPRRSTAMAAGLALGATLAVVAALQALPAVLDFEVDSLGRQGAAAAALCAALTAAAAAAHWLVLGTRHAVGTLRIGRRLRVAALVAALVAVVAGAVVLANAGERTEQLPTGTGRLVSVETNRGLMWRVALDAFREHPLTGVGSASFSVEWGRERKEPQRARDAHSLYVETMAELGIPGGLLLAAFGAALVLGIRRAARATPDDPVVVAAAAVLAAFAVHAGLDWDWEMPAVSLTVLVLVGLALGRPASNAEHRLAA